MKWFKKVSFIALLVVVTLAAIWKNTGVAYAAPFTYSSLAHIHIQSYDEEGKNSTGEMNDGTSKELLLFLADPNGNYVWQLCQTRADGNEVNTHYFHPAYGQPVRYKDANGAKNSLDNIANNHNSCDGAENAQPERFNHPDWTYRNWETGKVYSISTAGVGGDQPGLPDSNSQYTATAVVKIEITSPTNFKYTGPSVKSEGGKYVEGDTEQVVEFTIGEGLCTELSDHHRGCVDTPRQFVLHAFSSKGGGIAAIINSVMNFFIQQAINAISFLNGLIAKMITIPHHHFTNRTESGAIAAWNVARAMANSLFVGLLIVIAILNIVRYDIQRYDIRAALPRMLIAIIMVNFSLVIMGALVDVTNVATVAINNACTDAVNENIKESCLSGNLNFAGGGGLGGVANALYGEGLAARLLIVILVLIYLVVFLILILLLAFRFTLIIALTVTAPLALALYAFPATDKITKTWLTNLFRYLLVGPVIAFLLLVPIIFLQNLDEGPILNILLAIGFVVLAAMSPAMVGKGVLGSVGERIRKAVNARAKGLGKSAGKRAMASETGRSLAAGLRKTKIPVLRGAARPLGGVMERTAQGVLAERKKKAESQIAGLTVKEKSDMIKDGKVPSYVAAAALQSLADIDLAGEEDFANFFDNYTNSGELESVKSTAFSKVKSNPLVAQVMHDKWNKIGKGEGFAPNIADGTRSASVRMSAVDVAKATGGVWVEAGKPYRSEVMAARANFKMNKKTFENADQKHQGAILGTKEEHVSRVYDAAQRILRSAPAARRNADHVRAQLEALTLRDASGNVVFDGSDFRSFGKDKDRNEIVKGLLGI